MPLAHVSIVTDASHHLEIRSWAYFYPNVCKNWPETSYQDDVICTSYQHFTTVLVSVSVEHVTDMKRTHTTTAEVHFLFCALSFTFTFSPTFPLVSPPRPSQTPCEQTRLKGRHCQSVCYCSIVCICRSALTELEYAVEILVRFAKMSSQVKK